MVRFRASGARERYLPRVLRRWVRRLTMIGTHAVIWGSIVGLVPLWLPLVGLHDLVRRNRGAGLRMMVLLGTFSLAELLGVLGAGVIWLRHALGRSLGSDRWLEDNYRLQQRWTSALLGAAIRVLRLSFEVEGDATAVPGPVVVLMRHTSMLDTVLPVVFLGARHQLRLRYVLKTELQFDPCLDIVGNRLPNYFVDRAGTTPRELEALGRLADGLGPRDGALIYPEGTRFSVGKLARAKEKLAATNPELHELAAGLRRVLPPRPGGALTLLDRALPQGADVVVFTHSGLERLVSWRDMVSGEAIGTTVRVKIWRVSGAEVPASREQRLHWLFDRWHEIDALAVRHEADEA
ncbi:MAG: 1-acyl-sn-glycerol-3-phosphate acyltransferase [Myxococcota bacterium]